jgi:hypothetical protein
LALLFVPQEGGNVLRRPRRVFNQRCEAALRSSARFARIRVMLSRIVW